MSSEANQKHPQETTHIWTRWRQALLGSSRKCQVCLTSDRLWAATFFVDHATSYIYTHLQQGQTLIESNEAKAAYEQMAAAFGIIVKKFHTDNGIFAEEGFKSDVSDNN